MSHLCAQVNTVVATDWEQDAAIVWLLCCPPKKAVAFLGIAAAVACTPLNPTYHAEGLISACRTSVPERW